MSTNSGKREGAFLFFGIIISKIIGAVYRIPLINVLGSEGMGLYQLVFPVYALILTITSGAVPMALSKLVSARIFEGDNDGAYAVYSTCRNVISLFGLLGTLVLVFAARGLSLLQGSGEQTLAYIAIAPSVAIVAELSLYRGWCQGNLSMLPSSLSQISEQVFKLVFGLSLSVYLSSYGMEYAVCGALLAVTLSELCTVIILRIAFRRELPSKKQTASFDRVMYRSQLFTTLVPMSISGLVSPLIAFVDSMLIVNLLKSGGMEGGLAVSLFGLYGGAVQTLVNMPVVLVLTIAVYLIPYLNKLNAKRELDNIKRTVNFTVRATYFIAVPLAIFFFAFARQAITFIYPAVTPQELSYAATALQIGGTSVIFIVETQVFTSILNALNKQDKVMRILLLSGGLKLLFTVLLTSRMALGGPALASTIGYLVGALVSRIWFRRMLGGDGELIRSQTVMLFGGLMMALTSLLMLRVMPSGIGYSLIALLVALVSYMAIVLLCRAFEANELTVIRNAVKMKGRKSVNAPNE